MATSAGVVLFASGLPQFFLNDFFDVKVHNTPPEADCIQQYSLPEQIKAGGVLKVRIFIKNGPQDQRSTGASWFDDDSLLQLCFPDMMIHNFHNFVFEGLVPICQDIVVNQYKRKVF